MLLLQHQPSQPPGCLGAGGYKWTCKMPLLLQHSAYSLLARALIQAACKNAESHTPVCTVSSIYAATLVAATARIAATCPVWHAQPTLPPQYSPQHPTRDFFKVWALAISGDKMLGAQFFLATGLATGPTHPNILATKPASEKQLFLATRPPTPI